ncbi:MAG: AMP-binding protein [bacterium]
MMELSSYRDVSFSGPEAMRKVQNTLLQRHLAYCCEHSPYYRRVLKDCAATADNQGEMILDRLAQIPLTDKSEIERYNEDFCAVPRSRIVDIVLSSGTTGHPTPVMYTDHDLRRLAYNEEMSFKGCGMTSDDVVLLTCTIDRCFVAGLAYFLGVRSVGAAAIRSGQNSVESHWEIIKRMNPTVIVGVPTFLKKLGLYLLEKGAAPGQSGISSLVCIGEPVRDRRLALLKIGEDLETIWQAKIYSTYASSEVVTTFCECSIRQGGHLHPDLAVVEIIDRDGRVLPPGTVGEVVITPLQVEGMPLIRFKTGDMSFLIDEPCLCGRYSPRLGPVLGRKNQMMKIRGTTLYPQAVYSALEEMKAIQEYYLVVTRESELSDNLTVHVAVDETKGTTDRVTTEEVIQDQLKARLRVKPSVVIESIEAVRQQVYSPRSRKPIRYIDRR